MRATRTVAALAAALVLAGCASLQVERNLDEATRLAGVEGAKPRLARSEGERAEARQAVDAMLERPLSQDDAVRIAVAHGAALQATLFESAAASAVATQSARLANPVFAFERLTRREHGEVDKDIGRMLAFSVFDVFLLPARLRAADHQQRNLTLRAAGDIVAAAAEARQAWVRAVAAREAAGYARVVKDTADVSADLARRMQAVGNFSRLQRSREQAFYADAAAQLARAEAAAMAAREALVRLLGLDAGQAARLKLPERLPDLPAAPRDERVMTERALEQRLDVRMARAELDYLAATYGLTRVASWVDGLHVAAIRNSETGKAPQKGFEVEFPIPIFDFGGARRANAEATYLAAVNRAALAGAGAASQVREAYGAYRVAYDLARHYRDEIVPLRKMIADEMLLKYNGMLVGVFEVLAESRAQVSAVIQSIEAARDFWLAQAALDAALVGRPVGGMVPAMTPTTATPAGGGH